MGTLICSKICAKKATVVILVTTFVVLYTFVTPEFGRIFHSETLEVTNSTGVIRRSSPLFTPEEIRDLMKRRTKYSNRRLLLAELCTKSDISIFQGEMNPLPNGIPTFSVQIINLCTVGCPISNVHVSCGWFASAKLINPEIFRRLDFNDCLVNDGMSLNGGMETRHESNSTAQSLASNICDLVTRRVGRSVVISSRNRRFLANNHCSNKDISIIQSEEPNPGIPEYVVQIVNTCISDCAPVDIHVYCGWFASSPLVNPNQFKRLAYNDCLVNGGRPLPPGNICTDKDISITQSRDGTTGIPLFSVQIVNTCMSDCAPSDIHVNCGWFASSPPPNPNVFRRLAFNDCLVNNGKPLQQGNIIQFQYANSFMYPLTFKSAKFCRS